MGCLLQLPFILVLRHGLIKPRSHWIITGLASKFQGSPCQGFLPVWGLWTHTAFFFPSLCLFWDWSQVFMEAHYWQTQLHAPLQSVVKFLFHSSVSMKLIMELKLVQSLRSFCFSLHSARITDVQDHALFFSFLYLLLYLLLKLLKLNSGSYPC